jgi:starvation-inducible DNA-binding protein
MFEAQYTELWGATDAIAERIRALGLPVHATWSEFARRSSIAETRGAPEAMTMVAELVQGHEAAARTARALFARADEGADEGTLDLLTQRLQVHEKTAWMLRSLLA